MNEGGPKKVRLELEQIENLKPKLERIRAELERLREETPIVKFHWNTLVSITGGEFGNNEVYNAAASASSHPDIVYYGHIVALEDELRDLIESSEI